MRIAEDGVIELFGIDCRSFDRLFRRDCAQFLRGEVFQFSAIAPEGVRAPLTIAMSPGFSMKISSAENREPDSAV